MPPRGTTLCTYEEASCGPARRSSTPCLVKIGPLRRRPERASPDRERFAEPMGQVRRVHARRWVAGGRPFQDALEAVEHPHFREYRDEFPAFPSEFQQRFIE